MMFDETDNSASSDGADYLQASSAQRNVPQESKQTERIKTELGVVSSCN
jgi:hypothetical protein